MTAQLESALARVAREGADDAQRALIRLAVAAHAFNQAAAARQLGVTAQHLSRAIYRLGLDEEFRAARRATRGGR